MIRLDCFRGLIAELPHTRELGWLKGRKQAKNALLRVPERRRLGLVPTWISFWSGKPHTPYVETFVKDTWRVHSALQRPPPAYCLASGLE
jgi:hypothetical protein